VINVARFVMANNLTCIPYMSTYLKKLGGENCPGGWGRVSIFSSYPI